MLEDKADIIYQPIERIIYPREQVSEGTFYEVSVWLYPNLSKL